MAYLETIILSVKLWIWLFNNPGKWKHDSPYWEEIKEMKNTCPLCQYYINDVLCIKCVLKIKNICYSVYMNCSCNTNRPATAKMASALRREYEKITENKNTFRN